MATGPASENGQAPARLARALPAGAKTWVIAVAGLVLAAWGAHWIYQRSTHVYLDDARVDGEVVTLSSRVAGWVTELPVIEGDVVKKGQLLVKVDDRDSVLMRDALVAKLKQIENQMAVVQAQTGVVDKETLGRYDSENNRLAAAQAESAALDVQLKQARDDFRRAKELSDQKWLSPQAMERARSDYQRIEESQRKAQAEVAAARGTLSAAGGSRGQVHVMVRQLAVLVHQADEMRAEIRRRDIDIADRTIASPAEGRVVMTFVRQGEHVSPGQRILMFHDPAQIWVEANVKETEVRLLEPGMKAEIHVDAYPGRAFRGEVLRIGQTATSKFALLPDPNPSGNFTRITQRLPVRIGITDKDPALRPGMMVEVTIAVRNH